MYIVIWVKIIASNESLNNYWYEIKYTNYYGIYAISNNSYFLYEITSTKIQFLIL